MKVGRTAVAITMVVAIAITVSILGMACSSAQPTATPVLQVPTVAPTATSISSALPTAVPTPITAIPTTTPVSGVSPQYGGTVKWVGDINGMPGFDPHFYGIWQEYFVDELLYNNLIVFGLDGTLQPGLATSWSVSSDGKSITLNLAQGVTFQDGTPFNAQAVKYNLDRVRDPKVVGAYAQTLLTPIDSVTVVNDSTVVLQLKQPWRPILGILTDRPGMMVSPTAVEKYNSYSDIKGEYQKHPTGTGPFQLSQWLPSQQITLVRNPTYWVKGKPYLDGIQFIEQTDPTVELAMVQTNEANFMELPGLNYNFLTTAKNDPNLKIIGGPTGRTYHIQFNVTKAPYSNKLVRQAVGYALNRQQLIDTFFGGLGRLAGGQIGVGWGEDPNLQTFSYDPQKAKDLLTQAGYPNGISLDYWCTPDASAEEYCSAIQSQLADVGIKLNIIPILYSNMSQNAMSGTGSYMWDTWWSVRADPDTLLSILFETGGSNNSTHYSNPQVDQLLQQAGQIYDTTKAQPLYWKVQQIVGEDAPFVYIAHPNAYYIVWKNVQNLQMYPDVILRLGDVWISK